MAIMLDGTKIVNPTAKPASTKVTYKPPTKVNYTASSTLAKMKAEEERKRQAAQNAYTQRMQAQADAYKKQQQAMMQAQQQAQQQPKFNYNQAINQGYAPYQMQQQIKPGATMNMGPSQQSQNAWAQRYQQQAQQYGQQNASPTRPYNAVTNPAGYKSGMDYVRTLPNDWREQNASILMTPNEWLRRRNAWEKQYGNIFVSETEWQKRNAAAPPGYMWTPFGTGYAKLDTSGQATAPANTGGGDYGDWGYPDYGGGGGSTYTPKPPEWWVEMVQWRI